MFFPSLSLAEESAASERRCQSSERLRKKKQKKNTDEMIKVSDFYWRTFTFLRRSKILHGNLIFVTLVAVTLKLKSTYTFLGSLPFQQG